jgi:ribosome-associated toxin RatA of RatAB toxin-antitoxin module
LLSGKHFVWRPCKLALLLWVSIDNPISRRRSVCEWILMGVARGFVLDTPAVISSTWVLKVDGLEFKIATGRFARTTVNCDPVKSSYRCRLLSLAHRLSLNWMLFETLINVDFKFFECHENNWKIIYTVESSCRLDYFVSYQSTNLMEVSLLRSWNTQMLRSLKRGNIPDYLVYLLVLHLVEDTIGAYYYVVECLWTIRLVCYFW